MALFVVGSHNASPAEQDGLIHIRKEYGSNLGRFTGYPDQFLHSSPQSVHVNSSTRPRLEICNDRRLSRYSYWDTGWMSGDAGGRFPVRLMGRIRTRVQLALGIISLVRPKTDRSFSFKAGVTNVRSYTSTPFSRRGG